MTVRMTAAAADQVFLVSDQDSPTRQLLLSAQKLKTSFFFLYIYQTETKNWKSRLCHAAFALFVCSGSVCACVCSGP